MPECVLYSWAPWEDPGPDYHQENEISSPMEFTNFVLPRQRVLPGRPAGGDTLLRDPDTGTVHFLSPTATVVWECCDGKTLASECLARLRTTFAVPEETDLAADLSETVEDFRRRGLLEETAKISDAG